MATRDIGTKWALGLDLALLGWPVGVSLLALLGIAFGAGTSGVEGGLLGGLGVIFVGLPFLALGLGLVYAVSVYKDAQCLEAAGLEWRPSPLLYAVGGFLIPLVGYNYLWQRYKYLPRPSHDTVWWYATVVLGGLSVVASLLTFVGPNTLSFLVRLPAALVLSGLLGATIYMDARYLHERAAREGTGRLNPSNYLLGTWFATLVGTVLLPIQVFILAYYATKRRRIAGLH